MATTQRTEAKQAADKFVQMFKEFGEAVDKVFDDPELKKKTREFVDSAGASARTMANRFKDEEVKKKFGDVGKAADEFGKSVREYFKRGS